MDLRCKQVSPNPNPDSIIEYALSLRAPRILSVYTVDRPSADSVRPMDG